MPGLGLKQDVFPGREQAVRTNASVGMYELHCSEFCGAGHSRTDGTVVVMEPSAYEEWQSERSEGNGNASLAAAPA